MMAGPLRHLVGAALAGLCAALCAASALAGGGAPATPWPEVPDPPRSHSEWVARDARVNGLPMRISRFDSESSAEEVIAWYQAFWAKLPAGPPHRKRVGEWDTLSTLFGPFEIAVQVKSRSRQGSEGMVSVSNHGEIDRHWIPQDWPRWPGTDINEVTDSVDGRQRSQMVSMISRDGYELTVQRWRDEWARRGYTLVHQSSAVPGNGQRMWIAMFDKPPFQLDVTVTWVDRSQRSYIAANWLSPVTEGWK